MSDALVHGLTGSVSGVLSGILFYPFESLRTRLQSLKSSNPSYYNFLVELHKREGPFALYAGIKAFLICNVTSFGFYYYLYRTFQRILMRGSGGNTIIGYLKVSTLASILNVLINTPIWLVSTRLTLKQDAGIVDCVQSILKNEGVGGFFKGLKPTMMLITNPVIQYVCFEWAKKYFGHDQRVLSGLVLFLIGAWAKLLATIATYPLQTIKVRMHADKQVVPASFVDIVQDIYRDEGLPGFFHGIGSKILYTILNAGFVMASQEKLQLAVEQAIRGQQKPVALSAS